MLRQKQKVDWTKTLIYQSKETEVCNDVSPALNFPEVAKRGFGVKNRQHKHDDELEAQAQFNYMPRVAFQVKKKKTTFCINWQRN